jgi:hypothetical protein
MGGEGGIFSNSLHLVEIGPYRNTTKTLPILNIQGADDKLGQFLDQDIEASASHRNFLRHSIKSCSSLVSPNVNKPLISTKMSR